MKTLKYLASRLPVVFAGVGLLAVPGCGDDGLGKRYSVRGTVTYNGEPVPKGNIYFRPADGGARGRAAAGAIVDGKYTLSTLGNDDGAFPGAYTVTVAARDADYTQVKANAGAGAGRQDDVFKATQAAKSLVPAKFENPDKSPLKATVEEKSNTINFTLTD